MKVMRDLLYVPFHFEDGGTQVIHYTPETYSPREKNILVIDKFLRKTIKYIILMRG